MNVLLGIGGSEDAFRALETVAERTRAVGDDLTVAILENPESGSSPAEIERRVRETLDAVGLVVAGDAELDERPPATDEGGPATGDDGSVTDDDGSATDEGGSATGEYGSPTGEAAGATGDADRERAIGGGPGPVEIRHLTGNPGARLVEVADREGFDQIALGGGQRSPMGKIAVGEIAEFVLVNARTSVLLVR